MAKSHINKRKVYYLPIWFQAVKGASAVKSGIMNIPMVLSLVIVSIIAGIAVTTIGYCESKIVLKISNSLTFNRYAIDDRLIRNSSRWRWSALHPRPSL
jgi:hypothetical protein